jgi:hypothetical protein
LQQQQQQQKLLYRPITGYFSNNSRLYQELYAAKKRHHDHHQQQDLSIDTSTSTSIPIQHHPRSILFNHHTLIDIRQVVHSFIFIVMLTALSSSTISSSVNALDMEAFAAQQLLLDSSSSSSSSSSSMSTTTRSGSTTTITNKNNDDTTMSTDEALCRFSQPGIIKGDACVRAGISTENKKDPKNGVNAYGQINRGSYTKCSKEYTLVNTNTNTDNNQKPYWQSEWICQ